MESRERIRVFCVDDHPLLREGLTAIVNSQPDMALVAHAANGGEAINEYANHRPDVTLMDLRLPDMSGIDALIAIRHQEPTARIIILTTFEGDIEIQRALKAGARGYLLKSTPPSDLVEAIRQVHVGKRRIPPDVAAQLAESLSDDDLTPREIEVLRLVADGNRNQDIATRLFISEDTVKAHLKHIMLKLGATDRTQAVTIAMRRGIIHL
jgi:DNA-binding NarL/FixJ family response regulator